MDQHESLARAVRRIHSHFNQLVDVVDGGRNVDGATRRELDSAPATLPNLVGSDLVISLVVYEDELDSRGRGTLGATF